MAYLHFHISRGIVQLFDRVVAWCDSHGRAQQFLTYTDEQDEARATGTDAHVYACKRHSMGTIPRMLDGKVRSKNVGPLTYYNDLTISPRNKSLNVADEVEDTQVKGR